jgi:hypothetical protein
MVRTAFALLLLCAAIGCQGTTADPLPAPDLPNVDGVWVGAIGQDATDSTLFRYHVFHDAADSIYGFGERTTSRTFECEDGEVYVVTLTPRERPQGRGVDWRLNALSFETMDGRWVGSVPVYHNLRLDWLSDAELGEYLLAALGT